MLTSKEWWDITKMSPTMLHDWLRNQYYGEVMAARRLSVFREKIPVENSILKETLGRIQEDEARHAGWIGQLLHNRGIVPEVRNKKERYWEKTLSAIPNDQYYLLAVAAHAEEMRLERIKVIAEDMLAPFDIVSTFRKILKDETFHASAFRKLTTDQAYEAARGKHEEGLAALGLVI